jgi:hypothetical protein
VAKEPVSALNSIVAVLWFLFGGYAILVALSYWGKLHGPTVTSAIQEAAVAADTCVLLLLGYVVMRAAEKFVTMIGG